MFNIIEYLRRPHRLLTAILLLAIAAPLTVLLFDSLANLPVALRSAATATIAAVLLAGILMLARHVRELCLFTKVSALLTTFAVIALINASIGYGQPATSSVSLLYSDGSLVPGAPAAETNLWGRVLGTYGLHPAYDSVRVPEALIAHLRTSTKAIRVLVSKPSDAMFLPDGSPTDADGITLDMLAKDRNGKLLAQRVANITQEQFIEHRWIEVAFVAPSAIAEITIKVTPGPDGNTAYDATLLAIQQEGIRNISFVAGKIIVSSLGVFILALSGIKIVALSAASLNRRRWYLQIGLAWAPLVFATLLLVIVYWSASHTNFIYFWDFRNYWGKTEQIFELIMSGSWIPLASAILESRADDYTLFPAVPPAIVSTLIGYPNQLIYAISIALVYVLPTYFAILYLADRLFVGVGDTAKERAKLRLASATAILFGAPLYLGVALNLMPDIGGVFITIAALLLACRLSRIVGQGIGRTNPWRLPPELVSASIGLGVLLSAMFLFRRWYIFSAAGIVLAGLLALSYDFLRNKQQRVDVLRAATSAAILVATAAFPLLSLVLFDWASSIEAHDYASLYSAYAWPLSEDLDLFLRYFGVVVPILSILMLVLALFLKLDRRLLFFVAVPSVVGALLFRQVQSPGIQHYYLLMPLFGVGTAWVLSMLARHLGPAWAYAFVGVLAFGSIGATVNSPYRGQIAMIFPALDSWLPKQQVGLKGLEDIGDWLVSPDIRSLRFCVLASSTVVNQSIISELWQVMPSLGKHELAQRMIWLGDVDSRDGPPWRALAQCEIILVGSPPQTHLGIGRQRSVVLPAQDLISGKGIGVAYERFPVTFSLDENTEVIPFRRVRPLSDTEYQDLVQRFDEASSTPDPRELPDFGAETTR